MSTPDWYEGVTNARGVAVIGASSRPRMNHFQNHLTAYGFRGEIYPIHPTATELQGRRAYRSVLDIEGPVDLAVVMIAAPGVPAVVDECRRKGVPVVYIVSSGFAEIGPEGAARQEAVLRAAGDTTRILGPNGNGVANVANGQVAAAVDAVSPPLPSLTDDGIAVIAQSGIVAAATFLAAQREGIGVGKYFSVGNEADLGIPEILSRLVDDPSVRVILCYVEGLRDAPGFLEAASRARRAGKHVVVLKSGVTELGAQAAASHTASMAGEYRVYADVFRQHGIIVARSIEELTDIAGVLTRVGVVRNRVLVLSVSGAQGVMATDLLGAHGLELGQWRPDIRERLTAELPSFVSVHNPFDGGGPMVRDDAALESIMRAVRDDDSFDLVILCSCALPDTEAGMTERILELSQDITTPIVLVWQSSTGAAVSQFHQAGRAAFEHMDRAIAALGAVASSQGEDPAEAGEAPRFELEPGVGAQLAALVAGQSGAFDEVTSKQVLALGGIPVVDEVVCRNVDEAVEAASGMSYPLVAKLRSARLQHKTEANAVSLGIADDAELAAEVERLLTIGTTLGFDDADVVLQRQVDIGLELLLGMHTDPTFGRIVTVGLGGVLAEALDDVVLMTPTASRAEIVRGLRSLKHQKLLGGFRGKPALRHEQVVPVIERFCRLVQEFPAVVREVDVNPLVVTGDGKELLAVDALVVLGEPTAADGGDLLTEGLSGV
jgi:acetyltransferase